ncbi:MAG: hypothetical protein AAGI17_04945 [Planctomycetota bacterium]
MVTLGNDRPSTPETKPDAVCLTALRRGATATITAITAEGVGLDLGGHRLAVGDRITVQRRGNPTLIAIAERPGRSIRVGLCTGTARGVFVCPDCDETGCVEGARRR